MDDPVAYAVWHESEDAPGRIAYASPIKGLRGTGETRDGEEFIALYGRPSLTDAEREAVASAIWDYEQNDDDEDCARMVSTLRGLLERSQFATRESDRSQPIADCDATPQSHTTPGEGTVPPECTKDGGL